MRIFFSTKQVLNINFKVNEGNTKEKKIKLTKCKRLKEKELRKRKKKQF